MIRPMQKVRPATPDGLFHFCQMVFFCIFPPWNTALT